jgi:hypothetical protein
MAQSFLDREGVLILVVAVLALILLSAAGYFLWHPPEDGEQGSVRPPEPGPGTDTAVPPTPPVRDPATFPEVSYAGEDGKTVLELLKQDHQVQLDSELLLFGSIVLAIDTLKAGPGDYWIYYRDSLRGDRSPEVCTTHTGETIRWLLRSRK